MGGKIECQSRVGEGSLFVLTLRLPLASHLAHFGAAAAAGVASTLPRSRDPSLALSKQYEAVGAQTRQELGQPNHRSESSREEVEAEKTKEKLADADNKRAKPKAETKENGGKKQQATTATPEDRKSSGLKGKRVLLVEDNQVNQKVGVRMLNSLGCEAIVAANGLEAVNAVERHYDAGIREHADGPDRKTDAGEPASEKENGSDESNHEKERRANHIDLVLMDCQMPGTAHTAHTPHTRHTRHSHSLGGRYQ
jgi:CheY-like chemotaxis protein